MRPTSPTVPTTRWVLTICATTWSSIKSTWFSAGHAFAIVDEVDSILIDEARTPLIISGPGDESDPLYEKADRFARTLKCFRIKEIDSKKDDAEMGADADYIVDEKARNAVLTTSGTRKAEAYFGLENLADAENNAYMHHINNAIRAHGVMQRDVDYVVRDGQVLIVDSFTGTHYARAAATPTDCTRPSRPRRA